jgi:hypothetical protein
VISKPNTGCQSGLPTYDAGEDRARQGFLYRFTNERWKAVPDRSTKYRLQISLRDDLSVSGVTIKCKGPGLRDFVPLNVPPEWLDLAEWPDQVTALVIGNLDKQMRIDDYLSH